jgi:malonyl CoA-acyl carrier protein transacylase
MIGHIIKKYVSSGGGVAVLICLWQGVKKEMGGSLIDEVKEFLEVESKIDELLGYSLLRMYLDDPGGQLKQTQFTQPRLHVVNALHCYMALAAGARAEFLAGHSLGEYNALLAAGAFDLLTGLKLVKRRGELMAQATNGGGAWHGRERSRAGVTKQWHGWHRYRQL